MEIFIDDIYVFPIEVVKRVYINLNHYAMSIANIEFKQKVGCH